MKFRKPVSRFLFGLACLLIVLVAGFVWVGAVIPTWNATDEEIALALPGDEYIPQPQLDWNHGITIKAPAEEIYPWLIQMGDTRAAYYSYTFIENVFMMVGKSNDRYVNADHIHADWQNPPIGQGMIMDMFALQDYREGEYVLAGATEALNEMGMNWTWLWYLRPVDQDTTRLIVRHRFIFPEDAPQGAIEAVLNAGYVMERGMMLGIRNRAEGRVLPGPIEPLEIVLWLAALACGVISAVRYVRKPGRLHPLGIGLEAVVVLFIFTFIQPALWVRVALLLILIGSVLIDYYPGRVTKWVKSRFAKTM
ncbi:MAG: hypothetical protein JW987_15540 [Anaerolineaceae bacterium]|nr:hypothetical protein [Anaerolineaceae bacterium]